MVQELKTKHFGTVYYADEDVIHFIHGLPGFEDNKDFLLIHHEENSPFFWLQAIDPPEIALLVAEPWDYIQNYEFGFDEKEHKELKIKENGENILILNVVVIPEDYRKMTMNLLAPIVINTDEKLGKQIILDKEDYPIKYYLFSQEENL